MRQLLFLEMNEVIFSYLEKYISRGHLPTFARLFRKHGYIKTSSEDKYAELEPWIQWVSVHTGKTLKDHGVFRLGDAVGREHRQIWEYLEERGFRVGAISPMNAENRLKSPCFFLPDPWTETHGSGSWLLIRTYKAIKQAVIDNAQQKVTPRSLLLLLLGWLWYSKLSSMPTYFRLLAFSIQGHAWARAVFLDRLFGDIFVKLCSQKRPQFATLFLNAAAHIQHHFLYSSRAYDGQYKNPHWYIAPELDPLFEVYRVYDDIASDVVSMRTAPRIMVATGLQQEPHGQVTFYYRIKDHAKLLNSVGLHFQKVNPLMSRDFMIEFASMHEARIAEKVLRESVDAKGRPLFAVDNRGTSMFVELISHEEIKPGAFVRIGDHVVRDFDKQVAFVAIKNAQHNATGYLLDTGTQLSGEVQIPITEIWGRIESAVTA